MITGTILVCPLAAVDKVMRRDKPSHLVTLINKDMQIKTPESIKNEHHLRLIMHDISQPKDGYTPPGPAHIKTLLAFGWSWQHANLENRSSPLLLHCWAGISRSTAAAYILLCAFNPKTDEMQLAMSLRTAAPEATPNPLMIALADNLLQRGGRMRTAISTIGRGAFASEGKPFMLPARQNRQGGAS